mmetsp:Transcript_4518/g.9726  ORF Transcript_4518/g.9726 Transcript_4518/m.9726 type:complete len:486 (+) Transcript_4518:66-1523(+)|eukprot:CAMPEP_0201127650 /NCGR_PEP_ID=MMETSP0850-20130426/31006_1 /ASSEMBLY_ACC=CAM_ASM_000622 /TAXON_ID=183588 /ORGANISM="Pseudo-nitzschia fraudulenta, Strain WWA7" /LENGTH=485 /DNA_ID=CAMNT_0047396561 /DNA_START=68 /DNA_END=1525 /DNA_ORIENTATION=+
MVALSDREIPEPISSSGEDSSNTSSSSSSSPGPKTGLLAKSSASASALSPSALRKNLMTKSTIYRRHEARLARSYALRDDPRPVLLRVLSGLPGFRVIIPPWQSKSEQDLQKLGATNQEGKEAAPSVTLGAYSEETLFARYSDVVNNAASQTSSGIKNEDAGDCFRTVAREPVLQAMLAAGFCAGLGEYVFLHFDSNIKGRQAFATSSSSPSPFRNSPIAWSTSTASAQPQPSLFFRQHATVASVVTGFETSAGSREAANAVNDSALPKMANTKGGRPHTSAFSKAVLSAALPTSLLFGTKIFLDSSVDRRRRETGLNRGNDSLPATSNLLSSAVSGGVVGMVQLAVLQVQRRSQPSLTSSIVRQQQRLTHRHSLGLMGRNTLAAVAYFSVYEGVSSVASWRASSVSSNATASASSGTKGTTGILVGGALAGVVHAAAMNCHRYGHYGSMIWWSRVMLPAASRAAPIHALVFYGYESMKEGTKTA